MIANNIKVSSFLAAAAFFIISAAVSAEEIKLSTIMPAQDVLRVKNGVIGDNYKNASTYPDSTIPNSGLSVEGNVGIGLEPSITNGPYAMLHVKGNTPTGNGALLALQASRDNNCVDLQYFSKSDLNHDYQWDLTFRNSDPQDVTINNNFRLLRHNTSGAPGTGAGLMVMDWSYTTGNVGIGDVAHDTAPWDKKLWVNGDVYIGGNLTAVSKNFVIDHPLKKNMKLVHACVEGPENAVFYRGDAQLAAGKVVVNLPDYFKTLTRKEGRTVLLTAKGTEPFLLSYTDIIDNLFTVYGTKADGKFSWEVKAIRSDIAPLKVELPSDLT